MGQITCTLKHGLKIGEDVLREVTLREPRAGDIIEAQEESEKLVLVPRPDGKGGDPHLVASPTLVGVHVLRRQIVRIGNVQGPLSLSELKRLHPEDLGLIQARADEIDAAVATGLELLDRGRVDGVGGPA